MRELCPPILSFSKLWALAFIVIYPVGIPLFSILAMMHMGVHRLANQKVFHLVSLSIFGKLVKLELLVLIYKRFFFRSLLHSFLRFLEQNELSALTKNALI